MAFVLTSPAFRPGSTIPRDHTADGDDKAPPLAWTGAPAQTRSFALVCSDPDAPRGTFHHWGLYDIPADMDRLDEGYRPHGDVKTAVNDFGRTGWGGPAPPRGHPPHRYVFRLYALDVDLLAMKGTPDVAELVRAVVPNAIAHADLVGFYGR